MFLRRIRPRGRGRRQEYWVLLESYRTARGSRHRVVAYLGKLKGREVSGWARITGRLNGPPPSAPGLFEESEPPVDDVQEVDVKNIRLKNLKDFGPVYLGWMLWRLLGLDELLGRLMPSGQEEVPWSVTAAILCIARLCHPVVSGAALLSAERIAGPVGGVAGAGSDGPVVSGPGSIADAKEGDRAAPAKPAGNVVRSVLRVVAV